MLHHIPVRENKKMEWQVAGNKRAVYFDKSWT